MRRMRIQKRLESFEEAEIVNTSKSVCRKQAQRGISGEAKDTEPITFKKVIGEDRKKRGLWIQDRGLEWFVESVCLIS